jgi:Protein of unknown function with PCYCGC motif
MKRKWMLIGAVVGLAASAYFVIPLLRGQQNDLAGGGLMCHSGKCCKVCPGDFAKAEKTGGLSGRPVLNPLMFVGPAREAYIVAQQNPWLLAQLWCYCGCDRTSGHRCLLDCYRDYHGATCAICTGEALEANQLFNEGSPVEQIREALRARFSRHG